MLEKLLLGHYIVETVSKHACMWYWKDNSVSINWLRGQFCCWQKRVQLYWRETNHKLLRWLYFNCNYYFAFYSLACNNKMSKEKGKLEETGYIQHMASRNRNELKILIFLFSLQNSPSKLASVIGFGEANYMKV